MPCKAAAFVEGCIGMNTILNELSEATGTLLDVTRFPAVERNGRLDSKGNIQQFHRSYVRTQDGRGFFLDG